VGEVGDKDTMFWNGWDTQTCKVRKNTAHTWQSTDKTED